LSQEDELKELAEMRAWLEEKINSLQEDLDRSKRMLALVDKQLGERSFVRAATVKPEPTPAPSAPVRETQVAHEDRQLKRLSDGYLLATASISPDSVTITVAPDVVLRPTTSPFRSYFLGKVLGGMKSDDEKLVAEGKLKKENVLNFEVDDSGGRVRSVNITGYRDRVRLNEILSTATWTFTKMLEKQS
jgi:hypothetical protein